MALTSPRLTVEDTPEALYDLFDAEEVGDGLPMIPPTPARVARILTGVAGALYPGRSGFATPDLLLWTVSGEFLIMVMIGGLGTLAGPVIGGAFFIVLQEKVSSYVDWYFIVVGLVLVAIVLFMPKGLLGLRWRTTASS